MTPTTTLIEDLTSLETIKTWSLIVTLFGDLDGEPQVVLSGKDIGAILGHIGIKPEATRVALHRLKRDGWIDTQRAGREVFYSLSNRGKAETAAVYVDVYSQTVKYTEGWQLMFTEDSAEIPYVRLSRNLVLLPKTKSDTVKGVFLSIETEKPPVWFEHMIVSAKTLDLADRLLTLLEDFNRIDTNQSDLDSSALRLLFLHHWRKMALRESTWAHIWLNKDSPIARCHIGITTILSTLPKFGMLPKGH
ncbi:MAG: hypothetical protein VW297_04615 [Paracoccaceae bacterium]